VTEEDILSGLPFIALMAAISAIDPVVALILLGGTTITFVILLIVHAFATRSVGQESAQAAPRV
jgi:hypothetical protein